jgi:tetratricopeptide (TPR) repeat protein
MKHIALMLVVGLAGLAVAQSQPSPARMKLIEEAAYNRLTDQNDQWFSAGDFPRLIQNLRYVTLIWPHDYESATNLGWMLGNIKRYDEELAVYKTYAQNNPDDPDNTLPEANYYSRTRLYANIPPLLEPRLSHHPHPNVYRTLAHAYEHLNRLPDAIRVWKLYLAGHPSDSAGAMNLARDTKKLASAPPPRG